MASLFLVPQQDETGNDRDPIHIVRYDGSISGRILPPENCIEYSPPSATIDLRATALFFFLSMITHLGQIIDLCSGTHVYMPDTLANIV